MRVLGNVTKPIFSVDELRQESILDCIDVLLEKLNRLKISLDGIYPGDPVALPFTMYISKKLGIPIKTEKFLKREEKVLILFSSVPDQLKKINYLSERFIVEKLKVFRKRFPLSPSVLIFSSKDISSVDIQLLRFNKFSRVNTYRFLSSAYKNFYYPIEGEFTHFSQEIWDLAKKELSNFERARRIRDNSLKYAIEEFEPLKINEPDFDLIIWEKFKKLDISIPKLKKKKNEHIELRYEKLIDVKDPKNNSSVTFILELISQILEERFPTKLAYLNCEVSESTGILIVPSVKEMMDGVDLKFEVVLKTKTPTNLKNELKNLVNLLKSAFKSIIKEIMFEKAFRPHLDYVMEENIQKATVYVNWFFDKQMINSVYEQINKKWLLSRLYHRKRFMINRKELLKFLRDFEFNLENIDYLFSLMESMWKENSILFASMGKKLKEVLENKNLWPIIGVYILRNSPDSGIERIPMITGLLNFLLEIKGYQNLHEYFAKENRFFSPIITKRIYRPNWERTIKQNLKVKLTREPLNPESPVTYVLTDELGNYLGKIPELLGHYLSAKEESGKKINCKKLYFDGSVFSNKSYWVEIECL